MRFAPVVAKGGRDESHRLRICLRLAAAPGGSAGCSGFRLGSPLPGNWHTPCVSLPQMEIPPKPSSVILSQAMQATLFEFRNRWWMIFFIFFAAFSAYFIDPMNAGVATVDWLAKRWGTTATDNSYRLIFAFDALSLALAAFLRTWGTSYLQAEVMRDSRVHTEGGSSTPILQRISCGVD